MASEKKKNKKACRMVDKKIVIEFNPSYEMMNISQDNKNIFSGNYWDFDRTPRSLKIFLESLGLEVKLVELDGEDEDY